MARSIAWLAKNLALDAKEKAARRAAGLAAPGVARAIALRVAKLVGVALLFWPMIICGNFISAGADLAMRRMGGESQPVAWVAPQVADCGKYEGHGRFDPNGKLHYKGAPMTSLNGVYYEAPTGVGSIHFWCMSVGGVDKIVAFDALGKIGAAQWSFFPYQPPPHWKKVVIDENQTWRQYLELADIEPMGEATLAWQATRPHVSFRNMDDSGLLVIYALVFGMTGWGLAAAVAATVAWGARRAFLVVMAGRRAGWAQTLATTRAIASQAWSSCSTPLTIAAVWLSSVAVALSGLFALGIFALWLIDGPIPRPAGPVAYAARVESCSYVSPMDIDSINSVNTRSISCRKEADGSTWVVSRENGGDLHQETYAFTSSGAANSALLTLSSGFEKVLVNASSMEWRPVGPIKWSLRALAEAYGIKPLTEASRSRELWRLRFDIPAGVFGDMENAWVLWATCAGAAMALVLAAVGVPYGLYKCVGAAWRWLTASAKSARERALASPQMGSFLSRAESRELERTVGRGGPGAKKGGRL